MQPIIHAIADDLKTRLLATNAPAQGESIPTFVKFEEELDAHFDAFHKGELSKHKLEKFLLVNGYTKEMARDEIRDQIKTANFKNAARGRGAVI